MRFSEELPFSGTLHVITYRVQSPSVAKKPGVVSTDSGEWLNEEKTNSEGEERVAGSQGGGTPGRPGQEGSDQRQPPARRLAPADDNTLIRTFPNFRKKVKMNSV